MAEVIDFHSFCCDFTSRIEGALNLLAFTNSRTNEKRFLKRLKTVEMVKTDENGKKKNSEKR